MVKKSADWTRYKRSHRNHNYKRYYGITLADYEEMLAKQGGACAICMKKPTSRNLDVDHDHDTGRIRGLLCSSCNNGVGRFKANTALLLRAAEYVAED